MENETFPEKVWVELSTAETWAKKHRDHMAVEEPKNRINAYLIPSKALEGVLKLGTEAVRAYIGINDKNEKTLMFVGATYNKETKIYEDVFPESVMVGGEAKATDAPIVYDTSRPCPPYGDPNSPLA